MSRHEIGYRRDMSHLYASSGYFTVVNHSMILRPLPRATYVMCVYVQCYEDGSKVSDIVMITYTKSRLE